MIQTIDFTIIENWGKGFILCRHRKMGGLTVEADDVAGVAVDKLAVVVLDWSGKQRNYRHKVNILSQSDITFGFSHVVSFVLEL